VSQDETEGPKPVDGAPSGSEDQFRNEALDWFLRLHGETADAQVQKAFRAWCESDPRRAAAFASVAEMWGAPEFLRATENAAPSLAVQQKKTTQRQRVALVVAGIIMLWGAARAPDLMVWMRADYTTATGEQRSITLADGSRMMLNTASAVAVDFTDDTRAVTVLQGQAYFDVVHDSTRPFVVNGNYSRVAVTGTAFDVLLAPDEDEVALARGKVDVGRIGQLKDRVALSPGEAVYVRAEGAAPVHAIDTANAFAWVDGRISFNGRPLHQVLAQLRRYYRGRVVVWNSSLDTILVSGSYRLDDPALAIRSIAEAAGADVTALPGVIILR